MDLSRAGRSHGVSVCASKTDLEPVMLQTCKTNLEAPFWVSKRLQMQHSISAYVLDPCMHQATWWLPPITSTPVALKLGSSTRFEARCWRECLRVRVQGCVLSSLMSVCRTRGSWTSRVCIYRSTRPTSPPLTSYIGAGIGVGKCLAICLKASSLSTTLPLRSQSSDCTSSHSTRSSAERVARAHHERHAGASSPAPLAVTPHPSRYS